MTGDIRYYISAGGECRTYETAIKRETLMSHDISDRPFAMIGTDKFSSNGKAYLVPVDYCTNFMEVDYLAYTGAQTIIGKLKGALYRIQILCRRYTFWSYPAGITKAEISPSLFTPLSHHYRRVYSHHTKFYTVLL